MFREEDIEGIEFNGNAIDDGFGVFRYRCNDGVGIARQLVAVIDDGHGINIAGFRFK